MSEDIDEPEDQNEKKKGKKGGEAGALGQAKAPVSEACFELMKRFGVPMAKITEILRTWQHLKGEALIRHLAEFARGTARASAHLLVQFGRNGGFALVTDFLSNLSGRYVTPKAAPDQTPRPR